jgi:hypothetical protein
MYLLVTVVCLVCHGVVVEYRLLNVGCVVVNSCRVSIVKFLAVDCFVLPVPSSENDIAFTLHTILFLTHYYVFQFQFPYAVLL